MRGTITLRTLERWINKQNELPSDDGEVWNDGYDACLSDLAIQLCKWKGMKKKKGDKMTNCRYCGKKVGIKIIADVDFHEKCIGKHISKLESDLRKSKKTLK